jgi:tetratricopeptide (TPR) repeat protein
MIQRSKTKLFIFALIPSFLLFFLLIGIEYGLRFFRPDLGSPLILTSQTGDSEWIQVNRSYLSKYFSREDNFLPELKPAVFRKIKTPSTFRILCLGESTMFGTPYQMAATAPSIIRKQLSHLYPSVEFEVINAGASAVNSNVVLDLAQQFMDYEPDLILLYLGHNEYYGPDGVGAGILSKWFPFLIQFKYSIRDLYSIRALERLFTAEKLEQHSKTLMQAVSKGEFVQENSAEAEWVTENYERNMRKLFQLCRQRKVPIIVSDLTSNLQFPPFASSNGGNPIVYDLRSVIIKSMFEHDSLEQARMLLTNWLQRDTTDALPQFWIGKYKIAVHNYAEALYHFQKARDLDLLKFRAPTATIQALKRVCTEYSISLLSTDSLFLALSSNRITGKELFWEHLHPNGIGYYYLANSFLNAIESTNILQRRFGKSSDQILPFGDDSLDIAWLDRAYGDISISRLTSNWPFSNFHVDPDVIGSADPALVSVALSVHERSMGWGEGCYKTALIFRQKGKYTKAITTYRAMLNDFKYNFYDQYLLGSTYKEAGLLEKSRASLGTSVLLNPRYVNSRIDLGLILINLGSLDSAAIHLQTALSLLTKDQNIERAMAHYGLAAICANKKNFSEALRLLDLSISEFDEYLPARTFKQRLLTYLRKR